MEGGYEDKRLAEFRKFLHGFVGEKDSPSDDSVQTRGSIVGGLRLAVNEVPAEVYDWVLLYLQQRKCPHDLDSLLAKEVQYRIESLLPNIVPPVTNGGTDSDAESPDEGQYMLESDLLQKEMMVQLQQVCCQLLNSDTELSMRTSMFRQPQYQTSMVAIKNGRRKMEDRHVIIHDLGALCGIVDGPTQSYYAVFDGHSGVDAANFCSAHLHWNLVQHAKFECDPETAIRQAFAITEEQFFERSKRENIKSGCTALCCLIREGHVYLAWAGDSQAILVKNGIPHTVMAPHKPDREDEKLRVEQNGGCVVCLGTWRVNGVLAVSRALGDFEHKPCVSAEPEIVHMVLDGEEDFLVIACDGLWDTLTPNDATAAVYHYINQQNDDIDDIATQLAQQAVERGSSDNITAIVVFLRDLQSLAAHSAVTSFSCETAENHKNNPFSEESSEHAEGFLLENGDADYNLGMRIGDPISTNGPEEIYQPRSGLMPETTLISELPTPPIEDLIAGTYGAETGCGGSNPFAMSEQTEVHDSHAKEIASAILNSALESAKQGDAEIVQAFESDQNFGESTFFSGVEEVPAPLETVAENDNLVAAPKPWVLQVEHSTDPDKVDYLPDGQAMYKQLKSPVLFPDEVDHSFHEGEYTVSRFETDDPVGFEQGSKSAELHISRDQVLEVSNVLDTDYRCSETMETHFYAEQFGTSNVDLVPESLEKTSDSFADIPVDFEQHIQHVAALSAVEIESDVHETIPVQEQNAAEFGSDSNEFDATRFSQQFGNEYSQKYDQEAHSYNPFGEFEPPPYTGAQGGNQLQQSSDPFASLEHQSGFQSEFNPFGQAQDVQDVFGFAEETPSTIRPLQSVPEMIGFSEVVPGMQSSEALVAPESFMSAQKEVLAAFEDILVPSSPDQPLASTIADLLQPPNNNIFESVEDNQNEVVLAEPALDVAEVADNVMNLLESLPPPPLDTVLTPTAESENFHLEDHLESKPEEPVNHLTPIVVQNSLLADIIAPQMTVPELTNSEAVASLLASDVPPTPEVILDKIPDGVPEADGVVEDADSDSEKDGGWSYISGKGKAPTASEAEKKTMTATAAPIKKPSAIGKEPVKPTAKISTMKPTDTKAKPKPAASSTKTTTAATTTIKKSTVTDTMKKQTATAARPRPIASAPPRPPGSPAKTSTLMRPATSANKEGETKPVAAKTSTMIRSAPVPAKKTTPVPRPAASKVTSSTTTTIKTTTTSSAASSGTMRPAKPAAAATARPTSSTISRTARPATTLAATTTTLPKKSPATGTATVQRTATRVPPTKPSTTTSTLSSKTTRTLTEVKQTKDTVNKQLSRQPAVTLKNKTAGTATTTTTTTTINRTSAASKSSTLKTKTLKASTTSIKPITKPAAKTDNQESPKPVKVEQTKSEPEKGSLEEKGKENHTVDSGLASPESPVSPQLSLVNGNHSGDAAHQEPTAMLEQAELN